MKNLLYSVIILAGVVSTALAQVPAAPTASAATSTGATTFVANWSAVSGATGYAIDISTSNTFATFVTGYNNLSTSSLANATTTSGLVYSGLSSGTTYYYRIRAVNASGSSASSGTITVVTLPDRPVATSPASVSNISFTAQWDAVTGATGYRLDVATNQTFTSFATGYNNLNVTGTTQSVTGLTQGVTYYYRVRATHATGTSENSNVVNVKAVLQIPTAVAPTTIQSSSFYPIWTLVPGASNYKIDISTSNDFSSYVSYYHNFLVSDLTGATSTTGYAYSGMSSGTTYYYRVYAFNSSGSSGYSNIISVTTFPLIPTAGASTSATHTSFVANWSAANGASSYFLDVSTSSSFSSFVSGFQNLSVTGTSATVTGLAANSTYYYRVRAKNDAATSASSSTITAKTVVPPSTANAATNITTSGFNVNWTLVSGASNYYVDVSTSSAFSSFVSYYNNFPTSSLSGATSTSGNVNSSLSAGTLYYYRVRAANSSGSSVSSNVVSVLTMPTIPTATAATDRTTTALTANWNAVNGVTEYRVDVATNSTFTSMVSGYNNLSVATNSLNVTGLTINTTYYYRVRAVNATGTTSSSSTITTSTRGLPAPVANAATAVTTTSFYVNVTPVSGASYYLLDISTNPDFTSYVGTYQNSSFSAGGSISTYLSAGTTYYYRLRATGSLGESASSNVITVTTLPAVPTLTAATDITSISLSVNWNAVTGATGYRLDVSLNSSFSSYVSGYQNKAVIASPAAVTGLSPNTLYYYRLRAENTSGTSASSSNGSATTLLVGTPQATAATSLQATSFIANWNAVAGATEYRLDVSTAYSFSTYVSGYQNKLVSGTSDVVSGLTPNTVYYYRLRAKNAVATSGNSNIITVGKIVITEPVLGQYVGINSSITVRFTSPIYINNGVVKVYSGSTLVATFTDKYVFPGYDITLPTTGFSAGEAYRVKIEDGYNPSVHGWSDEFTINEARNFLKSTTLLKSGIATQTDVVTAGIAERKIQYMFFDGLGRPEQQVARQGSPLMKDVVTPFAFDKLGRKAKEYLPYIATTDDGWFKPDALKDPANNSSNEVTRYQSGKQYQFYQGGGVIADDDVPYSVTQFEPSALSRPLKQYGPGEAWAATTNDKYTEYRYASYMHGTGASPQEKVIAWTLDGSGMPVRAAALTDYVAAGGYYESKQLFVKITIDEEQKHAREYMDKEGRTILKKVQVSASPGALNSLTDWSLTYYLYDSKGNLRYVFPPELSRQLHTNADTYTVTATDLTNWAFLYTYDHRDRMTTKQSPGAGVIYMVYDKRNRLVLTQDANQRAGATNAIKYWTFTKYDLMNRPILTGIKDTTTSIQLTQAQMQAAVDAHYAKSWTSYGEIYVGNAAGNLHGYSNKSYPVYTTAGSADANAYQTATYYDDYAFRSTWTGSYNYVDENLSEVVNGVTYTQPDAAFDAVRGYVTGSKIKVLDGGTSWLKNVIYYDDAYQSIQTVADNQTGGTDLFTTLNDFTGKLLKSKSTHRALWRDRIGVSVYANAITRTGSASGWGTAGAASVRALPASTDGYIEVTVNDITNTRMIGFSLGNENTDYKTIDFAMYLSAGSVYAYERDVNRGSKGTIIVGDVLRLDRTGNSVKLYKNGASIYTFPTNTITALYADCALNSAGSALTGITLSWAPETHTIIKRMEYDHAGRIVNTWHTLDAGPEILIAKHGYNELGQLIDKKLHSTVSNGSDAWQSIDYRYNIRGWLTKINESDVNLSVESGEERDLFGMELGYNANIGVTNAALYNGNISAIKWSNNLSLGDVKENAYLYSYDAMNRLTASAYQEKSGTWSPAANNGFVETDFTYDLNGNIMSLKRNDGRASGWMDNLTYAYGSGTAQSNKLLSVTDGGDDFKGFIEGTNGAGTDDYTYDANGNMISDMNKGILTSLPIIYNHLNLPETVSKGTSTIRYTYDASGRKLFQTVSGTGPQKQTDYISEYVYTNGALQFIGHDEGRIVLAAEEKIFSFDGSHQNGITKTGADVTLTNETLNGETYLKASITAGATKRGISALAPAIPVTAGERYVYRVRGYRGGEAAALYVKGNSTDLVWAGASLPTGANIEAWVETYFTIPTGVTQLEAGVLLNSNTSATQLFYINGAELIRLASSAPEYQYDLKDHLGNVRMTFTTKQQTKTYTATFETGSAATEDADFSPSYDNVTFNTASLNNHTAPSSTRSQRLSASPTEIVGLAKSISVMPGDVVNLTVYAKYVAPTSTNSTVSTSTLAAAIAAGFGLSPTSTGEALKAYTSINQMFTTGGMMIGPGDWEDDDAPKAYLNYILFDKDFVPYDMGFDQIDEGATSAHDDLTLSAVVPKPGYIYVYLSNENSKIVDVFFDDLTIQHILGPVVQQDDYYAFGLSFNSYQRENSTVNNFLYNGKEKQDELDLGWMDYGARMYLPEVGRWGVVDPLAHEFFSRSPYNYGLNNPIMFIDPDGRKVDVSALMDPEGIDNSKGIYVLMNLLKSLSEATGNNIAYKEGMLVNKGKIKGATGSASAAKFLDRLINSDGVIKVGANSAESQANGGTGRNTVNLNEKQIDGFIASTQKAGLGSETLGYGMVFLHEALHTGTGSVEYKKMKGITDDGSNFNDDLTSKDVLGQTEAIVNTFRNELNWATREEYNSLITKDENGKVISQTMKFKDAKGNVRVVNFISMPPAEKAKRDVQAGGMWIMNYFKKK